MPPARFRPVGAEGAAATHRCTGGNLGSRSDQGGAAVLLLAILTMLQDEGAGASYSAGKITFYVVLAILVIWGITKLVSRSRRRD